MGVKGGGGFFLLDMMTLRDAVSCAPVRPSELGNPQKRANNRIFERLTCTAQSLASVFGMLQGLALQVLGVFLPVAVVGGSISRRRAVRFR